MNRYWENRLSIIRTFIKWKAKLCKYCENGFEEEDACTYLRDTLKQDNISFKEYFNLFSQKKDKSCMEKATLIDTMMRNICYFIQFFAINWRKSDSSKAKTFDSHVQIWLETD